MEEFLFENNVGGMRARELRNLLIQKLGVDPDLISRIIDREELKQMVTAIVYQKYQLQSREQFIHMSYKVAAVIGVVTILYLCRNIIWGCAVSIYEMVGESSYKSAKKFQLLVYNAKRKKYLGTLALAVSLLLELSVAWMQVAVMLSWILSRDHFLRRFMLPTLSFPVSANTLVGAAGGKAVNKSSGGSDGSIGATLGSYSLDVGPMITIAALNFLINKLDNFAAGVVLEHKRSKEERRYKKYQAAHPGSAQDGGAEGDSTDVGAEAASSPGNSKTASGLLHRRTSAAKTDAESIDDSLSAFFGRPGKRSSSKTPAEQAGDANAAGRTGQRGTSAVHGEDRPGSTFRTGVYSRGADTDGEGEENQYVPDILREDSHTGSEGAHSSGIKAGTRGTEKEPLHTSDDEGWLD
jgi:hypothetical protein